MTLHAEIRRLSRALLPGLDSRGQRTSVGLWAEFGAIVLSDVAEQMITPSHGLRSSHTVLTTALRQWLHGRTLTGEVDLSPAFVAAYQVPPFLIGTRAGVIHAVRSALNACYGDDPALAVRVAEIPVKLVNRQQFKMNTSKLGGSDRLGRYVRVHTGNVVVSVKVIDSPGKPISPLLKGGDLWAELSDAIANAGVGLTELYLALPSALQSSTLGASHWSLGRGFTVGAAGAPYEVAL